MLRTECGYEQELIFVQGLKVAWNVDHVWLGAGSSVELIESNTRQIADAIEASNNATTAAYDASLKCAMKVLGVPDVHQSARRCFTPSWLVSLVMRGKSYANSYM